jgi:hypothetical protein
MHKFFDVGKVGAYLETISHSTEKRKDGEQKVIVLTLRVEPFDTKLAAAVSQEARQTLFRLNDAQPWPHIQKAYFALGVPRQTMTIFATPDTAKASIALDQVLIGSVYARSIKDARGYALVFKAAFGPVGAKELEYVENWRNAMAFITFTQAEHNAEFELGAVDDDDEDEDDDAQPTLPAHEFDTDEKGRPADSGEQEKPGEPDAARHRLHSHTGGGKKRKAARR